MTATNKRSNRGYAANEPHAEREGHFVCAAIVDLSLRERLS
jgi:hypothetical protein